MNDLGWRNIDCFYEDGPRQDVLAHVRGSDARAMVYLIPEDRRGVIKLRPTNQISHWELASVPVKMSYRLLAFQVVDGRLSLAQEVVAAGTGNQKRNLVYEPVSPGELRRELSNLGNSK